MVVKGLETTKVYQYFKRCEQFPSCCVLYQISRLCSYEMFAFSDGEYELLGNGYSDQAQERTTEKTVS